MYELSYNFRWTSRAAMKQFRELYSRLHSLKITDLSESKFQDDLTISLYRDLKSDLVAIQKRMQLDGKKHYTVTLRKLAKNLWEKPWDKDKTSYQTKRFLIKISDNIDSKHRKNNRRIPIYIKPNSAFGSGQHATTLAILKAIEEMPTKNFQQVLDIGTGSGILLIALAKLQKSRSQIPAKKMIGTDISQKILRSAQENAALNQVAIQLRKNNFSQSGKEKFDCVFLNILYPALLPILSQLKPYLQKKGIVILSGFNQTQVPSMKKELKKLGFSVRKKVGVRSWYCIIARAS